MKRWGLRAFVVLAILLMVASVSISRGRTLTVTDMQGEPIAGVYVVYHYEGTTVALVESITYEATSIAIVKSGSDGRAAIPGHLSLHWPLLQSAAAIAVDLIYAPQLHNGLAWVNRRVAVSRPQEFDVSADLKAVRLADVSADPVRWEWTLGNLSSLIERIRSQQMRGEAAPPLTSELIEHFKLDYAAVLERYGETPRTPPPMPDAVRASSAQEKREWQAMIDKDLAARPLWKNELERAFGTEVRNRLLLQSAPH